MDRSEPPVPPDLLAIVERAAASGLDPRRVAVALGLRPVETEREAREAPDQADPESVDTGSSGAEAASA